jgi:hypothetical protein
MPNAEGSDNAQPTQETQAESPKFVSVEEVNRIITAREKRFESSLAKLLDDRIGAKKSAEAAEVVTSNEGKPAKVADPELARFRLEQDQLKRELAAEREKREAAERKQREGKAMALLQSELSSRVKPEFVPTLIKALRHDVEFDEAGEPLIKFGEAPLPIAQWADQWAKTKEADPYKPAPSAGGSGAARGNGRAGAYGAKPLAEWTEADREAFYRDRLAGRI